MMNNDFLKPTKQTKIQQQRIAIGWVSAFSSRCGSSCYKVIVFLPRALKQIYQGTAVIIMSIINLNGRLLNLAEKNKQEWEWKF